MISDCRILSPPPSGGETLTKRTVEGSRSVTASNLRLYRASCAAIPNRCTDVVVAHARRGAGNCPLGWKVRRHLKLKPGAPTNHPDRETASSGRSTSFVDIRPAAIFFSVGLRGRMAKAGSGGAKACSFPGGTIVVWSGQLNIGRARPTARADRVVVPVTF